MKKQMIAGGIGGVCLLALVGCSAYTISINQKMYSQMSKLQEQMKKVEAGQEEKSQEKPADESELTIGEHYHILDTSLISDAYKSGNTDSLQEQDKETLQMAKETLESIIKPEMTPYQQEEAIYQWMCTNVKFDDGSMSAIPTAGEFCDRPYGVLKNKKAVCVGYATTFRLFMEMLDIPCKVVHDKELSHSWDLVKLDEDWYHVDLTFDNNEDGSSGSYRNFNMTDVLAERNGHDWAREDYPAAKGFTYLAANQKKENIKNEMAVIEKIKQMIDKKDTCAFVDFEKEINEDFLTAIVLAIQERLGEDSSLDYSFVPISEEKSVFALYLNYFSDNELGNRNVDPKEYDKMIEKVDKVFGASVNFGEGDFAEDAQPKE